MLRSAPLLARLVRTQNCLLASPSREEVAAQPPLVHMALTLEPEGKYYTDPVVVLDFTAEWCLNCKTLEATVLQTPDVVAALDRGDVVPMKIDLTGENPDGVAKRNEAGRLTIPLLVVYGKDGTEIWKSDAYTPSQVLGAIEEADGTYGRSASAAAGESAADEPG